MKDYWFLLNQFEVREILSKSVSSYNLRIVRKIVICSSSHT
ncbi:hypothetical protein LEP1GSC049_1229 [Leptospira kirschneri serovar Cynopteri str. 3522 CT]|nr:hypothetical protein LEP1GSC126_3322 [Leptospira kirschneri str. 200801774]EPG49216.1 hypothetical protein LEP1GSC049_1229 [Leptospira kirschneri serovar Cynopteri str. 3522 CT]